MIRFAVIGTSIITEHFLSAAALCDGLELAAVYSRDGARGEAFAAAHGAREVFTDLSELAASKAVDAVYIASPNACHEPQSRLMLEGGKSVFCEKPIATSAAGYAALKAFADSRGLIYKEAIITRHTDARAPLLDALSKIGKIRLARIDYCQRSSRLDKLMAGEHVNIFDMSLHAGTLMDLGVYCVYAALDLLGTPKAILSAGKNLLPGGADGCGYAVFEYDGFNAVLTYSKTGQSAIGSEIIGDAGTVTLESVSQYAGIKLHAGGKVTDVFANPDRAHLMRGEACAFRDYVNGERLDDYVSASKLCLSVHTVMDEIKKTAGIVYGK